LYDKLIQDLAYLILVDCCFDGLSSLSNESVQRKAVRVQQKVDQAKDFQNSPVAENN
jgi:hypothetical protein